MGTEKQWLKSLVGTTGSQGLAGSAGVAGVANIARDDACGVARPNGVAEGISAAHLENPDGAGLCLAADAG